MDRIKNIKASNNTCTLFLQGVFKKDCQKLEDMLRNKIMTENPMNTQDVKQYDKIPVIFTSVASWLKSTTIPCWFCTRNFKSRPWFEPVSIEPYGDSTESNFITTKNKDEASVITQYYACSFRPPKKTFVIGVNGVFCSGNCVRAFINLHTKDITERCNKIEMLKFVYELFTGNKIPDIQPSPPPYEMLKFGGTYTELAYQQKIDGLDPAYVRELEDNNFSSLCSVLAAL